MFRQWLVAGCFMMLAPALRAEPPVAPRSLPPLAANLLESNSFDVRAFDPFGMPRTAPVSRFPWQPRQDAVQREAPVREAHIVTGPAFFTDAWHRDGFGSRP
jgi:hypothetical protein